MKRLAWEDLVVSPVFSKLFELNHKFIPEKMLGPSLAETMSTDDVASEGAPLEVLSMESPAPVPTMPRLPRSKPTPN